MKYDFLIIGSGFGGSVSAMRLAQKSYSVAVLEKGKRFQDKDFPKTNWNIFKFLWAPLFKCFGIQQITPLKGVFVLHGSGVGGGSLVYANTLMTPASDVFAKPGWPANIDWKKELEPHYKMATKMLGVTPNNILAESDFVLRELADQMGFLDTFHTTDVGVFQGAPGVTVKDPYFAGQGPDRTGCTACGGCMIGCQVGAKNTLEKNYLYFAEKWGVKIIPEIKVTKIIPISNKESQTAQSNDGYEVHGYSVHSLFFKKKFVYKAQNVILSAGVMGTVDLLFRNKERYKTLPLISDKLGETVRTNGESLIGVTSFEAHRNLSKGIAIGSAFHPDANTKIESVRYPSGSSVMKFLAVPLTGPGNAFVRPLKLLANIILKLPSTLKTYFAKDWAKQSIILLVMQSVESKMKLKMGSFFLKGDMGDEKIPSYLPFAQNAAVIMARIIKGAPQNCTSEVLMGAPATAHILGGCCMGSSKETGVIDSNGEVFGYKGLYVCDGSVVPVNLGVNPSLTITALAERFASQIPAKKELIPLNFGDSARS